MVQRPALLEPPARGAGRPTLQPMRDPQALSDPLRVRRAFTLLVLTLVVPGSAQIAAGSRRLGRIAVRSWAAVLVLIALLGVSWFLWRGVVLWLATSPFVLVVLAVALFAWALAWPLLVLDAWRLGRPALLPLRPRRVVTAFTLVLVAVTSVPLVAGGRRVLAAADLINGVFGTGRASAAADGRFNVLLLGGDAGPDRIGVRPDSVTLASIDVNTGRTVLLSLPRNLENVPFPAGSPAAKELPHGYSCGDTCLLNALYTWGGQHTSLFPGARDPGAEAMKQAVAGVTGLKVNYYVLVDLKGFRALIDAVGGIDLTVATKVPIGGGTSPVSGYISPGRQHLDGYHALWYARSRHGSSDYERMARQRCVMTAMVNQLDPTRLLARFQAIAAAGKQVVSTDIPAGELATFIDLGTRAKSQKITSVQFVPPLVRPAFPDFGVIRARVRTAIAAAQGGAAQGDAAGKPTASKRAVPSAGTPSAGATTASPVPAAGTDIRSVCSAA